MTPSDQTDPLTFIIEHCILKGEDIGKYTLTRNVDEERAAVLESAKRFLSDLIAAAEQRAALQGALNALVQLKQDRIAHTLNTPAGEWKREIDFIEEHILALGTFEQATRREQE